MRLALVVAAVAGFISFGSAAPATAGTTPQLSLSIDCAVSVSGIQTLCHSPNETGAGQHSVALVVKNEGTTATSIGSFWIEIFNPDETRLDAPSRDQNGFFDANPDFNQAAFTVGTWACGPGGVTSDTNSNPTIQNSRIVCFESTGDGPDLPPGGSITLAFVHYDLPPAPEGVVPLSIAVGQVSDEFQAGVECGPNLACNGASVYVFCRIAKADVDDNTIVNSADLGLTANRFGTSQATYDQDFNGIVNSADLAIVWGQFSKRSFHCP